MKIKFTCPICGGHILECKRTHTESEIEEIVGVDKEGSPIVSGAAPEHLESEEVSEYSCGLCHHKLGLDIEISNVIKNGLFDGWIEKVKE